MTQPASTEALEAEIKNMSYGETSANAVALAIFRMMQTTHLSVEQKLDIIGAALEMHRLSTLTDFLRLLTTAKTGGDYGLVTSNDEDRPAMAERLLQAVALSILTVENMRTKNAQRFLTLCEMLKPEQPEGVDTDNPDTVPDPAR